MTDDILKLLAAPFPADSIEWRVGPTMRDGNRGQALAYIDSRDVQQRLDEVCGLNWQCRYPWASDSKLCCEIGIKIDGEWVWRGDGAGDTDVEGNKGAFSDAMKRAAVKWGVARYLYALPMPWVELVQKGRSKSIDPKEMPRLRQLLNNAARMMPIESEPDTVEMPQGFVKKPKKELVLPPSAQEPDPIKVTTDRRLGPPRRRRSVSGETPVQEAEPGDDQGMVQAPRLVDLATQAANKGMWALQEFWKALGHEEKASIKAVLDTHLKPIAISVDEKRNMQPRVDAELASRELADQDQDREQRA